MDWALVIFLWFFLSWLNTVEGHKREFSLDDKSIQHTFAVVYVPTLPALLSG